MLRNSTYSRWHAKEQHLLWSQTLKNRTYFWRHAEDQHLLRATCWRTAVTQRCWRPALTQGDTLKNSTSSGYLCSLLCSALASPWQLWGFLADLVLHAIRLGTGGNAFPLYMCIGVIGDLFSIHICQVNCSAVRCFFPSSPFILYKGCIHQCLGLINEVQVSFHITSEFRSTGKSMNERFLGCKWCMHKQYSDLLRLQMNLKMEPFIYSGVLVERTTGKVIDTRQKKGCWQQNSASSASAVYAHFVLVIITNTSTHPIWLQREWFKKKYWTEKHSIQLKPLLWPWPWRQQHNTPNHDGAPSKLSWVAKAVVMVDNNTFHLIEVDSSVNGAPGQSARPKTDSKDFSHHLSVKAF